MSPVSISSNVCELAGSDCCKLLLDATEDLDRVERIKTVNELEQMKGEVRVLLLQQFGF